MRQPLAGVSALAHSHSHAHTYTLAHRQTALHRKFMRPLLLRIALVIVVVVVVVLVVWLLHICRTLCLLLCTRSLSLLTAQHCPTLILSSSSPSAALVVFRFIAFYIFKIPVFSIFVFL